MNIPISNDIIKEWNLNSVPKEKQKELADKIGLMVYQAMLVRSLEILSDKEQDELDALLDKDETTPQAVLLFLESKIPTFAQLLMDEKNNLKRDLMVAV